MTLGGVIFRDRSRSGADAEALIAAGKKWLCQDWRCPAHNSCAKHWGRSREYAAMADYRGALVWPERDDDADGCEHYVRDKPRAWLMPQKNQHIDCLAPALGVRK